MKIWDKIQEGISKGQDNLHGEETFHFERVLKGNYAYITTILTAQQFITDHCECDIAKARFFPMRYQMYMQRNSAYSAQANAM